MRATSSAPDHGRLRPYRFILLDQHDRQLLGEAFVQLKRQERAALTIAESQLEMSRALDGPSLFALVASIDEHIEGIPAYEQWMAVGAAVGNLLSAAHAMGYSGKMLSGRRVHCSLVRELFCESATERLVGFLYLGSDGSGESQTVERQAAR
jgi:nitroreductase